VPPRLSQPLTKLAPCSLVFRIISNRVEGFYLHSKPKVAGLKARVNGRIVSF
jgi:hypothetical protein